MRVTINAFPENRTDILHLDGWENTSSVLSFLLIKETQPSKLDGHDTSRGMYQIVRPLYIFSTWTLECSSKQSSIE